jgi:hypothetical protein
VIRATGQSLDGMVLVLDDLTNPGQLYTALSRVRNSSNLFVCWRGTCRPLDARVALAVRKAMDDAAASSAQLEAAPADYSEDYFLRPASAPQPRPGSDQSAPSASSVRSAPPPRSVASAAEPRRSRGRSPPRKKRRKAFDPPVGASTYVDDAAECSDADQDSDDADDQPTAADLAFVDNRAQDDALLAAELAALQQEDELEQDMELETQMLGWLDRRKASAAASREPSRAAPPAPGSRPPVFPVFDAAKKSAAERELRAKIEASLRSVRLRAVLVAVTSFSVGVCSMSTEARGASGPTDSWAGCCHGSACSDGSDCRVGCSVI